MGNERKRVSRELAEDPNYIAYKKALEAGEFDGMEPTSYLAFLDGKLIATANTKDEIFEKIKSEKGGVMMTQVKPEPIKLHGFFVDPDGNLRRGVPTWTVDEAGNETPVNLEWGSHKVYPREEGGSSEEE